MAFRLDRTPLAPPIRRADGSVVYEGALTRSGVFLYANPDGSIRREYRSPAEVGRADSLATLQLAHVVDDHPAERGQAKNRSVGAVGDSVRYDTGTRQVTGKVMVREDAVNAKVAQGKCQLSCGYDTKLVEQPGMTPEGERYDALQTDIVYEHVAIVAAGRAGPDVRLRLDALEAEDATDTRGDAANPHKDTIVMDLAAQLAAAIKDATEQRARADGLATQLTAAQAATATEKARADGLAAERDTLKERADKADKARQDAIDQGPAIARARVELELAAKPILGADFKFDAADGKPKPDTEVRLAVLDKLGTKIEPADRASDVYVKARFDGALATLAAAGQHVDAARGGAGGGTGGGAEPTEAQLQAAARKRNADLSKPAAAT
jgi:hypothetical protein